MLKPGKLDPELLEDLLGSTPLDDERVEIGPGIGRDVCAIRMDGRYLIAKTDPITFAADRIGWYVVQINANDLATSGARPRWFLVTSLLPENQTDERLVRSIWADLREALNSIDCALCGGHTEITIGLDRPILVGQMLGEVEAARLVRKESTRPGDHILITKGVPIEGTAVMAGEKPDRLAARFSDEQIQTARAFLEDPGISVVKEAMAACDVGGVHAMHDPTEGGIATGLWELARATGLGMRVEAGRIPMVEPGLAFCRHLGLDPLGVLSSGTLLLCVEAARAEAVADRIEKCGIPCADIGRMEEPDHGVLLVRDNGESPIPTYHRDEITRLWEK